MPLAILQERGQQPPFSETKRCIIGPYVKFSPIISIYLTGISLAKQATRRRPTQDSMVGISDNLAQEIKAFCRTTAIILCVSDKVY